MAATTARHTAKDMQDRLRRHYIKPGDPLPGGVYLPEVTMGAAGGGRADGLYVGFTSTRGHHLVGHEIKVTRADWLHELDNPEKAEVWASQCHAWYIVAPTRDIARVEELPEGWGLMVVNSRTTTRLDIVVRARVHEDRTPSWTATHSVVRRQDTLRAQAIADARTKAKADARTEMALELERRLANGGSDVDYRARSERSEKLIGEIAGALGVGSIGVGASGWGKILSVPELDAAFGRYVLADRDIGRAIASRARVLAQARSTLEHAMSEIRDAEKSVTSVLESA